MKSNELSSYPLFQAAYDALIKAFSGKFPEIKDVKVNVCVRNSLCPTGQNNCFDCLQVCLIEKNQHYKPWLHIVKSLGLNLLSRVELMRGLKSPDYKTIARICREMLDNLSGRCFYCGARLGNGQKHTACPFCGQPADTERPGTRQQPGVR